MIEEGEGGTMSKPVEGRGARERRKGKRLRLLDHHDRYLRTTLCPREADRTRVRWAAVRRSSTSMREASSERRRAGSPSLREARWTLSRGGQTKVGRAREVLRMECKDLTCREEEVLEDSRGEDRLVIKVAIKEAIVEDASEAHRVTVAVVITR